MTTGRCRTAPGSPNCWTWRWRTGHEDSGPAAGGVGNDGATVAAMVRLSLRDRHTDRRVPPACFSDNHLWLLPGEQRETEAEWSHGTEGRARPGLVVEGYDVSRSVTG
ncbi:hypothetical protein ACFRQM_02695 [Streptomyces sp. NPDC056831]|uniref:hypothetical protein n=1 Tax=Streptomyces sp. NPDC056831 TaxID=3345954 RepID=UPI00368F9CBF